MANKISPGDQFRNTPIWEAAFQNDLIDLVNHFKRGLLVNRPTGVNTHGDDNNIIKVRNDTGAAIAMGEAFKIGDYLLGAKFPKRRWFEALAIDTTFSTRIAVAAEPIPDDKIGRAYVAGMCPIKYTGTAPEPGDYMGPKPGSALLEKGYPAFARVEDITDSGTPKLLLGTLGEVRTLLCLTTGTIGPAATSSGFTVQSGDPSSNANSGFAPPTVHLGMTIDSGKLFVAHWLNNCWVGMPWECNDE